MRTRLLLMLAVSAGLEACAAHVAPSVVPAPVSAPPHAITITDHASVVLVEDPDRGGLIVSVRPILAGGQLGREMVDMTSATGRGWQAAFWRGRCTAIPDGALCAGAVDCLNPTQAGDACGRPTAGMVTAVDGLSSAVRFQPLDFSATTARPLDVTAITQIIAPGVIRLEYVVMNISAAVFADDAWQNAPVLFTPPAFAVVTADQYGPIDPPFENVVADQWQAESEIDWVARSTVDGITVALYVSGRHPWSIGIPGAQSPGAGWMQPLEWMELQPGEVAHLVAYIVVGQSLDQVRQRLGAIQ